MYDILNFPNGQPVILCRENDKVAMYVIENGRVFSRGIVFNNVCKDYRVFAGSNSVFYISTNSEIIFASLTAKRFVVLICMSLNSSNDSSSIRNVFPIEFCDNIFIFYTITSNTTHTLSVYYINVKCPNKSILVKNNISCSSHIDIYSTPKNIIIYLTENDRYLFYAFDKTMNFSCLYECSTIIDKNEIETLQLKLKSQEAELKKLQLSNQNIIKQNNELSQYAGKLQDEIRKIRYMN